MNIHRHGRIQDLDALGRFIDRHWDDARRCQSDDDGLVLGLPHPYFVASRRSGVRHFITEDLVFINEGLLALGRYREAREQIENIAHLTSRFGLVPANNLKKIRPAAAPPFLGLMVERYRQATNDDSVWVAAGPALTAELAFWHQHQLAQCGLNQTSQCRRFESGSSLGQSNGRSMRGHDEAGTVISAWFNVHLWFGERCLRDVHTARGEHLAAGRYAAAVSRREESMRRVLWDQAEGIFRDSVPAEGERVSLHIDATVFLPVLLGFANEEETRRILARLPDFECRHGLAASSRHLVSAQSFAWPALQWSAIHALLRGGSHDAAAKITWRYLSCVASNLRTTGDLWPAHDAVSGDVFPRHSRVLPGTMGTAGGVCAALIAGLRNDFFKISKSQHPEALRKGEEVCL